MKSCFSPELTGPVLADLEAANEAFARAYPGERPDRQPVHVVYGGAQLYEAESGGKLGGLALRSLQQYAPHSVDLARALGFAGAERFPSLPAEVARVEARLAADPLAVKAVDPDLWLAHTVYQRVLEKLGREPVEDFRIDFEDGYGNRPDEEEDADAARTALEVARGLEEGLLTPYLGIRIKPFNKEMTARGVRTLDVFVTTLAEATGGKLPDNFVVTLPKVQKPEEVTALVSLFELLEEKTALSPGTLKMEIMIETTQAIVGRDGRSNLPLLVDAARGRCTGAHFGTYDFTASCSITAAHQVMDHPSCDFALHFMKMAFAGSGIWLSNGATNVMPVGPHRRGPDDAPLSAAQLQENRAVVHRAWKLAYDHTTHSLEHAFYQGWDLHPAQLPVRYAAVYRFFLSGLEQAALRLRTFVEKAAQATLVGDVFDDAATGQGLLNFFLQGMGCGAFSEQEATDLTGLSVEDFRSRSFLQILERRKA